MWYPKIAGNLPKSSFIFKDSCTTPANICLIISIQFFLFSSSHSSSPLKSPLHLRTHNSLSPPRSARSLVGGRVVAPRSRGGRRPSVVRVASSRRRVVRRGLRRVGLVVQHSHARGARVVLDEPKPKLKRVQRVQRPVRPVRRQGTSEGGENQEGLSSVSIL